MPLFTRSDRIAILTLCLLIAAGWGVRLILQIHRKPDEVRVIRQAAPVPLSLQSAVKPDNGAPDTTGVIDINTATQEELESLPMIGRTRAAAVIEYRSVHGIFKHPEDIMQVKGIGRATFEKIKNRITTSPDNSLPEK